jgi:hypothetical protein
MIWDEPWTIVACQPGGTTIPPPRTPLEADQRFACVRGHKFLQNNVDLQVWADFVGTTWLVEELAQRLECAWIACLFNKDFLVATCVLRPPDKHRGAWLLETLRAKSGYGRTLIRAVIPWLFDKSGGPFTMTYTWELSLPALVGAFLKGWLRSAAAIHYGWVWSPSNESKESEGCGFCPSTRWEPIGPRLTLPTLFRDGSGSAVVSDSGLGDHWGYVSVIRGSPDWSSIVAKGGWRVLWYRGSVAPEGFRWSGEFVVVGLLNHRGGPVALEWISSEIS